MSNITELEFIQLLHQARRRLGGPNPVGGGDMTEDDDQDQGLVMKLDSRVPAPANICSQSQGVIDLALTSAFILTSVPDLLLKKLNLVSELVQKNSARLLPLLLYASLLFLGCQAVAVVVLLTSAILSAGLLFLLTCALVLGTLFIHTCQLGLDQQPSPPPSPSHSSTSLSNYMM